MGVIKTDNPAFLARAFNTSVLQKSRLPWVDYLRGIAIILVVYFHVLLGIEASGIYVPKYLSNANMIFHSFRMPLFFILSGIFISGSLARKTLSQLALIKFENLMYPYFIWSFIQVTIQIISGRYTNANRSLIDYTYILYQPRHLDQFWYLPALFNTTIIYLYIKTKVKPPVWVQFAFGIAAYFAYLYLQQISMLTNWMAFYIFFALGDFIAEYFFRESTQRFLKSPVTLLLSLPVFAAIQLFYVRHLPYYMSHNLGHVSFLLIALFGCFTMLLVAFRLQTWNILRFLRVLGYHSLYIYVMHVMIAALVRVILTHYFGIHNVLVLLPMGIAFGVVLPVMFYNLFVLNNFAWFLFSFHRKKAGKGPARANTPDTVAAS